MSRTLLGGTVHQTGMLCCSIPEAQHEEGLNNNNNNNNNCALEGDGMSLPEDAGQDYSIMALKKTQVYRWSDLGKFCLVKSDNRSDLG